MSVREGYYPEAHTDRADKIRLSRFNRDVTAHTILINVDIASER
jgi:hypothetical protein